MHLQDNILYLYLLFFANMHEQTIYFLYFTQVIVVLCVWAEMLPCCQTKDLKARNFASSTLCQMKHQYVSKERFRLYTFFLYSPSDAYVAENLDFELFNSDFQCCYMFSTCQIMLLCFTLFNLMAAFILLDLVVVSDNHIAFFHVYLTL